MKFTIVEKRYSDGPTHCAERLRRSFMLRVSSEALDHLNGFIDSEHSVLLPVLCVLARRSRPTPAPRGRAPCRINQRQKRAPSQRSRYFMRRTSVAVRAAR